jgi:hypothetical protein
MHFFILIHLYKIRRGTIAKARPKTFVRVHVFNNNIIQQKDIPDAVQYNF